MGRKDRDTLKGYFRKGVVPTEGQFAELIDSVPNIEDDVQTRVVLHEAKGEPAAWTLALTPEKGLAVINRNGETLLEIGQDKTLVLNTNTHPGGGGDEPKPEPAKPDYMEIKADKQWNDLVEVANGQESNRVYTVIALFSDPNLGVCSLTRATAVCLNSVEQWIESPRKHWWGWSGRIRLRWQEKNGKVCLQVRSKRRNYSGIMYCRIVEIFRK